VEGSLQNHRESIKGKGMESEVGWVGKAVSVGYEGRYHSLCYGQ
jgi:hypothetical protein